MFSPTDLAHLASTLGGLPIMGCLEGSPAAEAGLRYGDVLLSVDGEPTDSWSAFLAVRERAVDALHIRVFRQGATLELVLPLRPADKTPLAVLGELQERGILPSPDPVDTRSPETLKH